MELNSFRVHNQFKYRIYGLVVITNRPIKQFLSINSNKSIDLIVNFRKDCFKISERYLIKDRPIYVSNVVNFPEKPFLTVWREGQDANARFYIRYSKEENNVYFIYDNLSKTLEIFYSSKVRFQDVITFLSGPVMGCILRMKNQICLHAGVVNINKKAIAFIGPKQAGKSSIIAAFSERGYPILSDDIASISFTRNTYLVHPGYPSLRLWRNTVESLSQQDPETLVSVMSGVDKYYFPLRLKTEGSHKFNTFSLPLQGVVFLKDRNNENISRISNYSPIESYLKMQANIYVPYMFTKHLLKKEFDHFGQMLKNFLVLGLDRSDNLEDIDKSVDLVVEKYRNY